MGSDIFEKLAEKYPFITLCVYANNEYVGIVQNQDDAITTIYDFGSIQDLRTFANKDLEILHGPVCSLSEMARKKSKRKSITLVRRLD